MLSGTNVYQILEILRKLAAIMILFWNCGTRWRSYTVLVTVNWRLRHSKQSKASKATTNMKAVQYTHQICNIEIYKYINNRRKVTIKMMITGLIMKTAYICVNDWSLMKVWNVLNVLQRQAENSATLRSLEPVMPLSSDLSMSCFMHVHFIYAVSCEEFRGHNMTKMHIEERHIHTLLSLTCCLQPDIASTLGKEMSLTSSVSLTDFCHKLKT